MEIVFHVSATIGDTVLFEIADAIELKVMQNIIDSAYAKVIEQIKTAVQDDRLSDMECFMKVEDIICALERAGISGGFRHDFG